MIVEDDDRVIYGYLLCDDEIVADTWVCNRIEPADPEWKRSDAQDLMPFVNPAPFVDPSTAMGVASLDVSSLRASWAKDQDGMVDLLADGRRIARLERSSRVGWSALCVKDGPVARRLDARLSGLCPMITDGSDDF